MAPKMSEVLKSADFHKLEKIIQYIEKNGKITPKEAESVSGRSTATVRRYLKILVETEGSTNNSVYRVNI